MTKDRKRGEHGFAPPHSRENPDGPFKKVDEAERAAVHHRRAHIKSWGDTQGRDRTSCPSTGVALSGGGIRSASFSLGALQALDAYAGPEGTYSGIDGIDYLSTVSGGGYIGCALTAAMQKDGRFPFIYRKEFKDPPAVRHIRNYSNYLMPHGLLDAVTALGLIGRGLVANALIILPILIFFVAFTLLVHRTEKGLDDRKFLFWNVVELVRPYCPFLAEWLSGLPGFWGTALLLVVNVAFLAFWAVVKSLSVISMGSRPVEPGAQPSLSKKYASWEPKMPLGRGFKRLFPYDGSAELTGGLVGVSKLLFFAT